MSLEGTTRAIGEVARGRMEIEEPAVEDR